VAELHGGPEKWTSKHTSDIWMSQHPVDLSRLGYSGEKGMKVRSLDLQSREKREREEKSQISPLGGSGKKVSKVEPLNSRRRERRKALVLSLVGGRARRALIEGELYPFHDLGYRGIAEEESEVMTRELARL
jgi:hypothetical protein